MGCRRDCGGETRREVGEYMFFGVYNFERGEEKQIIKSSDEKNGLRKTRSKLKIPFY